MLKNDVFTFAGLTQTESKILSVLLKTGPAGPTQIAKIAGLFRRQVYDALDHLMHRNLVSFIIKNKKRVYSATDSEEIIQILKKRRDEIDSAIPELALAYASSAKENVTILTGIPGIKMMLNTTIEVLRENPEKNKYYVMLTDLSALRLLGNWLRRWHKKRASMGFDGHLIFTSDAAWRGKQLEKLAHTKIRYVQGGQKIPVGLHSCGDYAWVIFWGKESPLAIQINDGKIARAFDEYFQRIWVSAEVTPPRGAKISPFSRTFKTTS